jgi:hypothetical protein
LKNTTIGADDKVYLRTRFWRDTWRRAKGLLEAAKRAVEIAIEDDEAAALEFLEAPGTRPARLFYT